MIRNVPPRKQKLWLVLPAFLGLVLSPACKSSGGGTGGAGSGGNSGQAGASGQGGSGQAGQGGSGGSGGSTASGGAGSGGSAGKGGNGGGGAGGSAGKGGNGGGAAGSGGSAGSGGATGGSGGKGGSGGGAAGAAGGGAAGSAGATGGSAGGGAAGQGGAAGGGAAGSGGDYVVSLLQASKANATDLSQADIADLVGKAITQAGGLDFIKDGQTVVLKPNLVTPYSDTASSMPLDPFVNGIATDWRVVKAVADLVRAKNPSGKILVMEGSVVPAATAFNILGYTSTNFGKSVDEFLAFEGASCTDRSTTNLVKKTSHGKELWLNKRYAEADVVISIPTMKTHLSAGITGSVKNLGIGATPVGQYAASTQSNSNDCTRGQTKDYIDHSTAETLGEFIRIYYSARPADFVVMDGLQGLQNGPASQWTSNNYNGDKMNMRLILAGRNAVAVDTVEALVMKCDPKKVPHLTKLEADGLGTTDISKITVVGKAIGDVAKPFATSSATSSICPGK